MPSWILQFRIVPAPDLFQDEVDRPQREPAVGAAGRDAGRAEEECRRPLAGVARPFLLQIVGQRLPRIGGEEHRPFCPALALHPGQSSLPRLVQAVHAVGHELVQVEGEQLLAP
jgi:hypothetical protein